MEHRIKYWQILLKAVFQKRHESSWNIMQNSPFKSALLLCSQKIMHVPYFGLGKLMFSVWAHVFVCVSGVGGRRKFSQACLVCVCRRGCVFTDFALQL
jgi:hypothetical protein